MAAPWAVFLCDCRQTLRVEPARLDLPTLHVQCASDPERDAPRFAELLRRERCTHALVACCTPPEFFAEMLGADGNRLPLLHHVNLKEFCFWPHPDSAAAHAKASRLLRAAMRAAEAQGDPEYRPLHVGDRVLIVTDLPQGVRLAEQVRAVAQPSLLLLDATLVAQGVPRWRLHRGQLLSVSGRLGDFHVTFTEAASGAETRELHADQVVLVTREAPPVKARTGCHVLVNPSEAALASLVARLGDLMGDFLKVVHVSYDADICAGGASGREACGMCLSACPYTAIARDPENHLRVRVDHLACEGCGACVAACPTSALRFTDPAPAAFYARLAGLLAPLAGGDGERLVVLFHCGEEGRRLLEEAGRRPLPYPATVLPVEVPCLRFVSAAAMLTAFRLGAAGVALLGCETCQHGEREVLLQQLAFGHLTLEAFALGKERLRLFTTASGQEETTVASLSRFAQSLDAAPLRWQEVAWRQTGNREVLAAAVGAFIEQLGREPGQRRLPPSQPFAFAEVNAAGCTLCRSCVNVCPVHAFQLDKATSSLQYKHFACTACGLCAAVCPEQVIALRHEVYFERAALDYQTVVQDEMVGCSKCGKPFVNRKALEAVEARVLSLASLLDTFSGKRRALLRMCPDCRAVAAMFEVEAGWEP
ncbi:MAG: 4Fe-4S ferredoxin [Candidatus Tectimicrobiota bacterium]|nr:MAG: 4Fe-4S ferredoxin [Candidatus Tectomicrobia bacterium]